MSHEPRLLDWALAFALTQCIEMAIYVRVFRIRPTIAFGASAITHPFVWFVFPRVWTRACVAYLGGCVAWHGIDTWYWGYGLLAESFAVAIECGYFSAFGVSKPMKVSLVGNAASAITGLVLTRLIGWP